MDENKLSQLTTEEIFIEGIRVGMEQQKRISEQELDDLFKRMQLKNTLTGKPIWNVQQFNEWETAFIAKKKELGQYKEPRTHICLDDPDPDSISIYTTTFMQTVNAILRIRYPGQEAIYKYADKKEADDEVLNIFGFLCCWAELILSEPHDKIENIVSLLAIMRAGGLSYNFMPSILKNTAEIYKGISRSQSIIRSKNATDAFLAFTNELIQANGSSKEIMYRKTQIPYAASILSEFIYLYKSYISRLDHIPTEDEIVFEDDYCS